MRNNQPVSNREVEVLDDQAIVSKTDLNGNITYVNPYFTEISGFSEQELIGAPQNIVRHPDMPVEAFADLWASIKSGTPWTGLVKNRCKNGDFYWVRANVTPIRENGRTIGFMSVRTRPERQQVAQAEQVYRTMRTESNHGIRIKNGQVIEPGVGSLLSRLSHVSLGMRIWLATSMVNVLQVIVCGAVLLDGNSAHNYGIFAATFLGLLINVFLWYTLRVSVLQPLDRALQGARSIAAGDLSSSFDTEATDEVGQLLRALQQMNSNLIATIRDVRVNVETMAVATRQIAAGNADLSGRTEAQAASLEETASSVEQFSSTVKQNADNSEQANKLAQSASEVAVQGGVIVADVIATMDEINSSSRKIVDIIGLIEGIAFQTNILALNAAVEAARAGEQGRGFAVVAGEVRNLAQRSATAAKDIKNLIDVSVGKVSAGMVQVDRAGATMKEVVASVQQVTAIMREISVASHEQSIGVDQVNSAIAHMDQVTQQNAALVEEAAAATASLAMEAGGLTQAVSLFKFGPARSTARAARTSRPAVQNVKRLAA
ncbi:methyl-accepting chemotaxis sensory transducer with Pas/Pac sensor [Duganella sp. CF402]|uniref:methyl-accepting chemotaxis protein n=1 Tax=unclassified Duganella TaxID=2636909 RepID=UPI0008CDC755|nr:MULTISPECIES: PAS domain-containing methyl-accepting chemotaxis protein [unclassified Duganella]RZT05589.1 methyl-accepting chemotaxis sensory transducer with Pas/Pac sensor [Duganella sp. BK701]SEM98428.1 methyl-accepting chemotaxis sensory transducer with Pas/Pac sensor [Duganella sp. CF402]